MMIFDIFKRFSVWVSLGLILLVIALYIRLQAIEIDMLHYKNAVNTCTTTLTEQNNAVLRLREQSLLQQKRVDLAVKRAEEEGKKNQKELDHLKSINIPSECNKAIKVGVKEAMNFNNFPT